VTVTTKNSVGRRLNEVSRTPCLLRPRSNVGPRESCAGNQTSHGKWAYGLFCDGRLSAPGLRRRFAAAHHIFAHAALTDVDAEFEQRAVDAGCTPTGILSAHLADQFTDLAGDDRSPRLAVPHLPGPEKTKALAMPGNDRFCLDDGQRRAPVTPGAGQADPQQPVQLRQLRVLRFSLLEDGDVGVGVFPEGEETLISGL
jgi:hypothetical protein